MFIALRVAGLLTTIVVLSVTTPLALAQNPCGDTVTVQPGDTLYDIARRCETTVAALVAANPTINNRAYLQVGQIISIPTEDDFVDPAPVAAIYPASGAPGSNVQVFGNGFPANTEVRIGFGPIASEYVTTQTAFADEYGAVSAVINVPPVTSVPDNWVFVVETLDNQFSATTFPFTITDGQGQPQPTPAPGDENPDQATFTNADIYLVATGDAGQSGIEFGCEDSLVPVEVNFEPTVAPLTAALEELFAIDSETYGQSGLYNALYQSNLSIDSINIVNGAATIRLNGNLTLGGTCDTPRATAQIEQTALQYSTIDSVRIYVNGEQLNPVLSA